MDDFEHTLDLPLGPLMDDIDGLLTKHTYATLRRRGMQPPGDQIILLSRRASLSPQQRDQLRNFYTVRFAIAVTAGIRYQQRENLDSARRFGATYAELSKATGYSRQSIQQRWGLTERELRDARTAIADAVAVLPPPLSHPADARWSVEPDRHNYDPEADLWAAEVSLEGATGGSPKQVLLFHRNEFLGPATSAETDSNFPGTELVLAGCTSSNARVQFQIKNRTNPNASPPPPPQIVNLTSLYRWIDGGVVRYGDDLPAGATSFARDGRTAAAS